MRFEISSLGCTRNQTHITVLQQSPNTINRHESQSKPSTLQTQVTIMQEISPELSKLGRVEETKMFQKRKVQQRTSTATLHTLKAPTAAAMTRTVLPYLSVISLRERSVLILPASPPPQKTYSWYLCKKVKSISSFPHRTPKISRVCHTPSHTNLHLLCPDTFSWPSKAAANGTTDSGATASEIRNKIKQAPDDFSLGLTCIR